MSELKKDLNKNGYVIIKSLLNKDEVNKFSEIIKKICNQKKAKRVDDLYNYQETWDYIINKKLLDELKKNISSEIFYMHDSGISHYEKDFLEVNKNSISWHRDTDSAPNIKDVVPYCKNSKYYNVFTAITYVSPNNNGGSLNIIPKSHNKNFRLSFKNLLRIFHWRTKNNRKYYFIRNFIERLLGKNCKLESGDCIIFYTTLFHKVVKSNTIRQAIVARYAPKSESSENYINYVLKNSSNEERNGYKINEKNSDKIQRFFNILKKKKIFYNIENF